MRHSVFIGALLFIASWGQSVRAQAKAEARSSPSPNITITAYTADKFPEFPRMDISAAIQPEGFVITNHGTRSVIGMAVLWDKTFPDGHHATDTVRSSPFGDATMIPTLAPGESALAVPGVEYLIGKLQPGRSYLLPGIGGSRRSINLPALAVMSLDAVIWEDGELIGPNESNYDVDIQSRKLAAQQVANTVRAAQQRGESPTVLLTSMTKPPGLNADPKAHWVSIFAGQLLHVPPDMFEHQLETMENWPAPPAIHRQRQPEE